jgi:hypothetical protein
VQQVLPMELNMLDGSIDDILFQPLSREKAAYADGWIGISEATICQFICCLLPKNIIQRYRVQFPWKPSDQEFRYNIHIYWSFGEFSWRLSSRKHRYIALKHCPLGRYFPWDLGGQELCTKL